ncbi:MAG: hypothetical protein Q8M03_07010, partial [Legionella sp.]|nr:hypothetical protein [Legionella sp.]
AAITSAVADAGDEIAIAICARAGRDLAEQALAAARRAGWGDQAIPCALAGGVVLGSQRVRDAFVEAMHRHGLVPAPLVLIEAPVEGAIMLARRLAAARGATS